MSWFRSSIPAGLLSIWAFAASADPLTYLMQGTRTVALVIEGQAQVTYNPLVGPPVSNYVIFVSNLDGQPTGGAVADVGLPGQFAGGAHGLLLESFEADTEFDENALLLTDVFDVLLPLLPVPPPIPLSGALFFLDIAELRVRLDAPLSAPLISTAPNEFTWAGEAPITIEGTLEPVLFIPGQAPILPPAGGEFSLSMPAAALLGGFKSNEAQTGTRLDVGLAPVEVVPDTALLMEPLGVQLGALGSFTVDLTTLRIRIDASYTGRNNDYPLPPPPPAGGLPGCGIGPELALLMPVLGWLSRRRRGDAA